MCSSDLIKGTIGTDFILRNFGGTPQTGFTAAITSSSLVNANMLEITFTKTAHGLTDASWSISTTAFGLDAEL